MDSYDKSYLDIDELAKKIEARIKELEIQEKETKEEKEYSNKKIEKNIADLDEIIRQIDERIAKFEEENSKEKDLDVVDLTDKVNNKLAKLDEIADEDVGKTIYDLGEISNAINETIKKLEAKKKKKKAMKAKYCDLARKNKKCNKK